MRNVSYYRTEPSGISVGWNASVDKLLREWSCQLKERSIRCVYCYKKFMLMHYVVGIPNAVLTAAISTGIFSVFQTVNSSNCESSSWILLAMGIMGIIATVLSAIQTFMNFADKAELYSSSSKNYEAVYREIDGLLSMPVYLRGDPVEVVQHVRGLYDNAVLNSPDNSNDPHLSIKPAIPPPKPPLDGGTWDIHDGSSGSLGSPTQHDSSNEGININSKPGTKFGFDRPDTRVSIDGENDENDYHDNALDTVLSLSGEYDLEKELYRRDTGVDCTISRDRD